MYEDNELDLLFGKFSSVTTGHAEHFHREDSLAVRSSRPHVRGERGEDGRRKAAHAGLASLSNMAEKRESENYEFHGHD